jgi:hypothetical protein
VGVNVDDVELPGVRVGVGEAVAVDVGVSVEVGVGVGVEVEVLVGDAVGVIVGVLLEVAVGSFSSKRWSYAAAGPGSAGDCDGADGNASMTN